MHPLLAKHPALAPLLERQAHLARRWAVVQQRFVEADSEYRRAQVKRAAAVEAALAEGSPLPPPLSPPLEGIDVAGERHKFTAEQEALQQEIDETIAALRQELEADLRATKAGYRTQRQPHEEALAMLDAAEAEVDAALAEVIRAGRPGARVEV